MMCAKKDDLDLPSLWNRQRLILIHLDEHKLTEDLAPAFAGMIAHSLFITAMRKPGCRPVVLCMDEIAQLEKMVGTAVQRTLSVARQQRLRFLAAAQHFHQLSKDLQEELLTNTSYRAFFALGDTDSDTIGQRLGKGRGTEVRRMSLTAGNGQASVWHKIIDHRGNQLCVSDDAWHRLKTSSNPLAILKELCQSSGIPYLRVVLPNNERYDLWQYLDGLSPGCLRFSGPDPLKLVVVFPQPTVRVLDQKSESEQARSLSHRLAFLPPAQAVMRTDTDMLGLVKVVNVEFPDPLPELSDYLANGQRSEEINETLAWREAQADTLAVATPPPSGAATRAAVKRTRRSTPDVNEEGNL